MHTISQVFSEMGKFVNLVIEQSKKLLSAKERLYYGYPLGVFSPSNFLLIQVAGRGFKRNNVKHTKIMQLGRN